MDRQDVVGQRKLLAGSGIERYQNDEPRAQHRRVRIVLATRQFADERLSGDRYHLDENLALTVTGRRILVADRAHRADADGAFAGNLMSSDYEPTNEAQS